MDFEKFSDRLKGFIQAAQTIALREGHQQFTPEHLLKVLLDDAEGLCRRARRQAGGRSKEALGRDRGGACQLPKVSGGGAGQPQMSPAPPPRSSTRRSRSPRRPANSFVTVERALQALGDEKTAKTQRSSRMPG